MRTLLAALLCVVLPQGAQPHISLRWVDDGEAFVSVRVDSMPVQDVVNLLALEAGATVEGFHKNQRPAPVTVDLRERPLRESLSAILGSVGLRAEVRSGSTWRIQPLIDPDATAEDLERMAYTAFAFVVREHRDHAEMAPAAEWAQAEIREQQGNALAARSHYDALVSAHPDSNLVPEALLRAGAALSQSGDYLQARQRFENLVRLDRTHKLVLPARVALARCAAELGEWQQALWQLDALDRSDPPVNDDELRDRRHIRTRALIDGERYSEALGILRALEDEQPVGADRLRLLRLLATCYESVGDAAVAGRAWMAVAEATTGPEREEALVRSARLALDAGEPLVTILVQESALHEETGESTQTQLDELAQRARVELDIDVETVTPESRAERGAELSRAGLHSEALAILEPLLSEETLGTSARASVLLDVARCLETLQGAQTAISLLREWLPRFEEATDRSRLYVFAADILERSDDLEGAAAALQGRL